MPSMRLSVDKIQLRKEPLGLCECQQELQNVKLKKTNKFTKRIRDLYPPPSIIDRVNRHKISQDIEKLNKIINKPGLFYKHRAIHSKTSEYTCFSTTHGTFYKVIICPRKQSQ